MKKREDTVQRALNLTEQLRIGSDEARVHIDTDDAHEAELVVQAAKIGTKGEGLPIIIGQEPVTDESGTLTGIDVVCRLKAS